MISTNREEWGLSESDLGSLNLWFLSLLVICHNIELVPIQVSTVRLQPGADLKSELVRLASDNQLWAAAVISAVGNLSRVALRFAN